MYKRILVAVDGSSTAEHALRHAIGLAKRLSAALRVVHVVDMGVLPLGPELAIDIGAVTKARRAAGEQIIQQARATCQADGIEAEMRLLETGTSIQRHCRRVASRSGDCRHAWPHRRAAPAARQRGRRHSAGFTCTGVVDPVALRDSVC
jgi:nucleotide-binding universal stress UspA family protein